MGSKIRRGATAPQSYDSISRVCALFKSRFDEHATNCEARIGFEDRYDDSNPLHASSEVHALSLPANAYIWCRAGYNMCRRRANRILRGRGTSFA